MDEQSNESHVYGVTPAARDGGLALREPVFGASGEPGQKVRGIETGLGENGGFPHRCPSLGWRAKGLLCGAEGRGPGGERGRQSAA